MLQSKGTQQGRSKVNANVLAKKKIETRLIDFVPLCKLDRKTAKIEIKKTIKIIRIMSHY